MNYRDYVVNKLCEFTQEDIFISHHALIRLNQRRISRKEILENIINPKRLQYAVRQQADTLSEEKFDCYFSYSKTQCYRYVLVIKMNIVVVTVIRIHKRWQRLVEKKIR